MGGEEELKNNEDLKLILMTPNDKLTSTTAEVICSLFSVTQIAYWHHLVIHEISINVSNNLFPTF